MNGPSKCVFSLNDTEHVGSCFMLLDIIVIINITFYLSEYSGQSGNTGNNENPWVQKHRYLNECVSVLKCIEHSPTSIMFNIIINVLAICQQQSDCHIQATSKVLEVCVSVYHYVYIIAFLIDTLLWLVLN